MYPYYRYDQPYYPAPHYPYPPYYSSIQNDSIPYIPYRTYPPVNPNIFMSSAKHMQVIMLDASSLLEKMASNRKFSYELMSAAQQSNKRKVQELIHSSGIKSNPQVTYNPDGLKLTFIANDKQSDCCQLSLNLRWF
ncbi:hypothetical protein [Bacillus massilinigeriensis]|uniref:hypothetical protein n=1 Tax=Bacillus massilionigeriensis TaxID=1805475 RepID=UPI00096AEDF6|nr:hypothetical protein [Bacillus massilionigeriensis]